VCVPEESPCEAGGCEQLPGWALGVCR